MSSQYGKVGDLQKEQVALLVGLGWPVDEVARLMNWRIARVERLCEDPDMQERITQVRRSETFETDVNIVRLQLELKTAVDALIRMVKNPDHPDHYKATVRLIDQFIHMKKEVGVRVTHAGSMDVIHKQIGDGIQELKRIYEKVENTPLEDDPHILVGAAALPALVPGAVTETQTTRAKEMFEEGKYIGSCPDRVVPEE